MKEPRRSRAARRHPRRDGNLRRGGFGRGLQKNDAGHHGCAANGVDASMHRTYVPPVTAQAARTIFMRRASLLDVVDRPRRTRTDRSSTSAAPHPDRDPPERRPPVPGVARVGSSRYPSKIIPPREYRQRRRRAEATGTGPDDLNAFFSLRRSDPRERQAGPSRRSRVPDRRNRPGQHRSHDMPADSTRASAPAGSAKNSFGNRA
jgi:hypothetical protein